MLTFLMLIFALISDALVQSSAEGHTLLRVNPVINDVKNKKEISTPISLINNNKTTIEFIENEILYKHVKGTVYHAVESQCDNTPLQTADMSIIDTAHVNELRWVALSRDLIKRRFTDPHRKKHVWSGKIKLGDTIWIDYDNKNLWKITHQNFKHVNHKHDSIIQARNDQKYVKLKNKYEQIKGYWIVHDVMGTQYTLKDREGNYILDKNGKRQVIHITKAIDFLQHPELGMLDVWDRNIIISKRKVKYITSEQMFVASK